MPSLREYKDRVEFRRESSISFSLPTQAAGRARRNDQAVVGRVGNGAEANEGCAERIVRGASQHGTGAAAASSEKREERASFIGGALVHEKGFLSRERVRVHLRRVRRISEQISYIENARERDRRSEKEKEREGKREKEKEREREREKEREREDSVLCRGVARGRDGRPIRWRSSYPVSSDRLLT